MKKSFIECDIMDIKLVLKYPHSLNVKQSNKFQKSEFSKTLYTIFV